MKLAHRKDSLVPTGRRLCVWCGVALGLQHVFVQGQGPTVSIHSNSEPITINDFSSEKLGQATPYPAIINVSGISKPVTTVTVTLVGLTHNKSRDIKILLVGPRGQHVVLMSETGGNTGSAAAISNATLTFDDTAQSSLPTNAPVTSGNFKPALFAGLNSPSFPDEPAGIRSDQLAAFKDPDANGPWRLFVVDGSTGGSGSIAKGWSLSRNDAVRFRVSG